MKIANKISLSFLITAVILTTVAVSITYIIIRKDLKKAIYDHLMTAAKSRASHIETFLEEHKQIMELLANQLIFKEIFTESRNSPGYSEKFERVKKELDNVVKVNREFIHAHLINKEGNIICSTLKEMTGFKSRSTRIIFSEVKKGIYISDMYFSEGGGKPVICIAAPIFNNDDFLGVITAVTDPKQIYEILQDRTGMGKTGEVYLVDKDFYMISPSRFREDLILKQKVNTQNAKYCMEHKNEEQMHMSEMISIFTDYRGINVLGTHVYIPGMQWALLAEIDEKEALAPLGRIRVFFIALLVCIPLAAWLIGISVSRIISGPISKLNKGTEIIGKGNLEYKVGIESNDEIGRLSKAFDKMTEDLKETTTSIVDLNREINERKLAEEALRESEERYKHLVDYANDLIYRTDANGNFTFCNPIALRLMEYSEDELIGKNYIDLIKPDYRQDAEKFYGVQFVKNITNTYHEFPVITKNGKEIWLGQNVQLIMEGDKVVGFQAVARDITDRKMAEEALRKASNLETLTIVLENFISDSLGNLLTPIYTHIELCKIQDSIDQIKSSLDEITKGITRLLTGINAYRRFSKLGEASLGSISSVDIRSILGPLISGQRLETYGEEEFPIDPNVKLRFVFDPKKEGALTWEELPPVSGSEIEIATALQETLINAVESHDPQKSGEVMVSAKKADHNLILEITDKGRGMSSDERDKSQLPFFKILGIKKSGRLGLGAYIAYESAKYCGGDIQIESTEGVGTTASIILKVND